MPGVDGTHVDAVENVADAARDAAAAAAPTARPRPRSRRRRPGRPRDAVRVLLPERDAPRAQDLAERREALRDVVVEPKAVELVGPRGHIGRGLCTRGAAELGRGLIARGLIGRAAEEVPPVLPPMPDGRMPENGLEARGAGALIFAPAASCSVSCLTCCCSSRTILSRSFSCASRSASRGVIGADMVVWAVGANASTLEWPI